MSVQKLAVIGVGNWGQNLLRNFCALLGEKRVIACDKDSQRLQKVQRQYPRLGVATDPLEVLHNPQVEAVAIATPAITHYELARQALTAGKHTFVEKPLALRAAEAEELIALAEKDKRVLIVDHLLEYHPVVEQLKQLIDNGELGELFYLYSQRLNFGVVRTEENALWSLGPHDISVMLFLLGREPKRVWAYGACYLQEGMEDVIFACLEFPQAITAHLHLSWLNPVKVRKLVVIGSQKMAVFDDAASQKLILFDKRATKGRNGFVLQDEGTHPVSLEAAEEPLRAVCKHFLNCIESGERPRSDGQDGLRVLRVLEAVQHSLAKGGQRVSFQEGEIL
jgi:UDP-2-acetamido-3-amino-2,3-dideoxy-glucuronate N-acetyltransferase